MTTYAESVGRAPFDWGAFLAADVHTESEWFEVLRLARNWPTCACGHQCASIPRDSDGIPKDSQLFTFGCRFAHYIEARDLPIARATFARIESRSAELLAEMGMVRVILKPFPGLCTARTNAQSA